MLSINQFVAKYNGKYLDFDGYYGGQCVDLVQFWSRNLGYQRFWGNAKDIINQAGSNYIRVNRTITRKPNPGDIVVIVGGPADPRWGHTAVVLSSSYTSFKSFDQNWPPNSPCHVQGHSYSGVVGWLRPRKLNPKPVPIKPPTTVVYYKVRSGDSLGLIAKRYLGSVTKYPTLVTWNKARYPSLVRNPNYIVPGWVLVVRR